MKRASYATSTGLFLVLSACGRGTAVDLLDDGGTSMEPVQGFDAGDADGGRDAAVVPVRDAEVDPPDDDAGQAVADAGDGDRDGGGPADDGDWVMPRAPELAARPPMGWSSAKRVGCAVSETLIRGVADAMVANGMREAGYEYVHIDDCWQTTRTEDGTPVADPNTFAGGIRALGDYVHARGLKLGLYASRGTETCAGRPGSQGHEARDAETFALWGVDYLKYDSCSASLDAETQYRTMQDALAATGRPVVLGIATRGFAEFMPSVGQLWRTHDDLQDRWDSMLGAVDRNFFYGAYARPGAFNDPDALTVGNGGMTEAEYRAQFSLWAMMAAPLLATNDLATMTPAIRDILTNEEVIAVDQDPWGYQGYRVQSDGGLEIWARPLAGVGQRAVLFFNRTSSAVNLNVRLEDIGLSPGTATVRNLWQHTDLGTVRDAPRGQRLPERPDLDIRGERLGRGRARPQRQRLVRPRRSAHEGGWHGLHEGPRGACGLAHSLPPRRQVHALPVGGGPRRRGRQ
jgi:alpha-galactosidase